MRVSTEPVTCAVDWLGQWPCLPLLMQSSFAMLLLAMSHCRPALAFPSSELPGQDPSCCGLAQRLCPETMTQSVIPKFLVCTEAAGWSPTGQPEGCHAAARASQSEFCGARKAEWSPSHYHIALCILLRSVGQGQSILSQSLSPGCWALAPAAAASSESKLASDTVKTSHYPELNLSRLCPLH